MAAPHGYSPISSESRVRILAMLLERADRTIDELTEATGLHPNTVREHLQRLIESGFVLQSIEHRTTRGRPRTLYRAATGGDGSSSPVIRRKATEAAERGDMMRRIMPETIPDGLDADELHQLDAVVEHLEESGFDPVVDEVELTVDLSPCQHAAASGPNGTRCSVHLSLLRSVLTEVGGPLDVGEMRPACDPTDCVIQLMRRKPDEIAS
ncbi:helix-turn-helix transcriptional regulator [Microbacterium gorillae]|uniref:helix-turn-helix transcriptional regulator n=1 Tax=Microbacterium gorillae TaxID=1231063 RepID=UPI00058E1C8B|nr:ArsR family transcriptional regulator [Microbacterium gorillae]